MSRRDKCVLAREKLNDFLNPKYHKKLQSKQIMMLNMFRLSLQFMYSLSFFRIENKDSYFVTNTQKVVLLIA